MKRSASIVVLTGGALLAGLLAAPATWLASAVGSLSEERVLLADADGFWWRGSAWLAVTPRDAAPLTLPGRFSWTFDPLRAGFRIHGAPWVTQPFVAYWRGHGELTPGSLQLPAAVLQGFGPPLTTLRPRGELKVAWQSASQVTVDWVNAASPLSPLPRLGDYRLDWNQGRATLTTLRGPLHLEGVAAAGQRFSGTARSDPEAAGQLSGLLNLLGPVRNGTTSFRF
jgi:general secretion pathway protein N